MKTYYIEIERQGYTLAIVKVEADNYEQAQLKALKALHLNDDISEISEDTAYDRLQLGDIDYIIDEDGNEIDLEDLEDVDEDSGEISYILYTQDESWFENEYKFTNLDNAIKEAKRIWGDGENGYCVVAVYDNRDNRLWYADHNMDNN